MASAAHLGQFAIFAVEAVSSQDAARKASLTQMKAMAWEIVQKTCLLSLED